MSNYNKRKLKISILVILVTIVLDQLTKWMVRGSLSQTIPVTYFGDFILFQHVQNTGAFLSLGSTLSEGARFWILTIMVALFLVFALVYLFKDQKLKTLNIVSLSLVIAGGIGNLIDRIAVGSVTDFVQIGIGWLRTGVFNVADVAISFGVCVLFFNSKE